MSISVYPTAKHLKFQRPSAQRGKSSERTRSQDRCSRTWRTSWGQAEEQTQVTPCPGDAANLMPLTWRGGNRAATLEKRRYDNCREVTLWQEGILWEGGDNSQGLLYSSFIFEVPPRERHSRDNIWKVRFLPFIPH